MIPLDESKCVSAYLCAMSKTKSPQEFCEAVIPVLRRDTHQSFTLRAFEAAEKHASLEQLDLLKGSIKDQNIRTSIGR